MGYNSDTDNSGEVYFVVGEAEWLIVVSCGNIRWGRDAAGSAQCHAVAYIAIQHSTS